MATTKTVDLPLLGVPELAELLGVEIMDVKNWRRRGKLPEPVAVLFYGPVWSKSQFPTKLCYKLTEKRRES